MKLTFQSMFAKLRTCELLLFLNFAGQIIEIIKKLKFQDMPEVPRHFNDNFFFQEFKDTLDACYWPNQGRQD